jgi:hypothetical protein
VTHQIPIFRNEITALGGFAGGVTLGSDFASDGFEF